MIKQNILYLLLISSIFSCQSQNKNMDIRTTSINDYEATYIFNLENNKTALKKINDYALQEIKAQNIFIDSLKHAASEDIQPKTFKERLNSTTLSLIPEDIIFYTPPNQLMDRVREKDIVIHYVINTESGTIKNIRIGNQFKNAPPTIKVINENKNNCNLQLDQLDFTLQSLYTIVSKITKLQYQNKSFDFIYTVKDKNNAPLLDIIYTDHGQSLLLNYN